MIGLVCSDSIGVQDVTKTDLSLQHCVSYAVFIGAVVSIVLLAVICIVVLVALLRRERRHQIKEYGRPPSRESFLKERNKRCQDTTELDVLPTQPSSEELGHANLPSTSVEFPRDLGAPSRNI
ncbi:uncharacterized protein LOC117301287 [Asterias rubens]|uniref:uncharacterized protein LOC117301287 n=1 Tax=Asterias rubens TaxID=7604 RepID=UPI001455A5DB|nr:uncharacterized protein LOC117301287 [Asterias rubens]